jgi:hypothetical protein
VLIPILYLKGVSTGDFEEALVALLGKDAGGLSASTIGRLKDGAPVRPRRRKHRLLPLKVHRLFARLEPVSVGIRTSLCSRTRIPPGKGLARPETGPAFLTIMANSAWQRLTCLASPAGRPRNVKDYSDRAAKFLAAETGLSGVCDGKAAGT